MRLPSSTRSRAGCGRAATSSKMLGCWVLAIEVKIYQQVISLVTGLAAPSIFGIYSGPHLELGNDPDTPPGERFRRVLLDPVVCAAVRSGATIGARVPSPTRRKQRRSEEHTSELQSLAYLVCRLLLEKKKKKKNDIYIRV